MEKLSGKTALVTGSTDGVGRLVARNLPTWRICPVVSRVKHRRAGSIEGPEVRNPVPSSREFCEPPVPLPAQAVRERALIASGLIASLAV